MFQHKRIRCTLVQHHRTILAIQPLLLKQRVPFNNPKQNRTHLLQFFHIRPLCFLKSVTGYRGAHWSHSSALTAAAQLAAAAQRLHHLFGRLRRSYERNKRTLLGTSASLLVTSALLVVTRKLLRAPGIATRSKNSTRGSWPRY